MKKSKLFLLTYISVVFFFLVLLGLIFGIANDWRFVLGWLFWISFCTPTLVITTYFLKEDPALIERRVIPQETRPKQIIGQSIAGVLFIALIVIPVIDYRNKWSTLPFAVSLIADICVVAGFVIVFKVFKENTFASRAIEVMDNQKVIKSGIYSKVRHPMYLGAGLVILATPFSLGSLLGILIALPLIIVIVFRIMDEEKMLMEELDGYCDYCNETKYRLIPYVW
ncbi:methyltransferase family protein [Dysosmobacter sp.]|uniref:methyltransferase family protein n=1 Tax=Dysosmobacter sp. TaxID=2591382 RepID=UPI002A897DE7|nr:isoprenylcysteine carboxylmethyltransferase family protein [Dysosmobacter sp.]MDY3281954.1 isoprenylcysteine carboxylmethyltransferase family protein [Dysosmobacter sp.]